MEQNVGRFGDIFQATLYGQRVYVINSPELAEQVLLKNWRNYLRKGAAVKRIALSLGNGLISSNGDFWANQRRMIQPNFTREAVAAWHGIFVQTSLELRERWCGAAAEGRAVDVTRDVSAAVLETTLLCIFGADYHRVRAHFDVIAEESRNLEFAQTCRSLAEIIITVVRQRRAAGRACDDILGGMMRARQRQGGDPMPEAQVAREALTLVIAGHETTASVLNWVWYLLGKYAEVDATLSTELARLLPEDEAPAHALLPAFGYARRVLEEALRSYPPLWLMTRKAVLPDQLGCYRVPAGTEVYISPYLLQRHPQLWEDPDRFDPERFGDGAADARHPLQMCPFGAGPRNCIGEYFARTEMQVHLVTIARQLRMRYDVAPSADWTAGVNLLSREHFIMFPQLRSTPPRRPIKASTLRHPSLPTLAARR
jgi:cytochrome P450